jgi:DNA-binding SARP family transcriptional activator
MCCRGRGQRFADDVGPRMPKSDKMSKAERKRGTAPFALEIQLLGPFRLMVDGAPVEERRWSRRKPKLVVKLLALEPHHQLHREQVMEMLWPEQEPESASNSLHKAIHMARRALEPALRSAADSHFILTQGQQIVLSAPGGLRVDVEEFERAAAKAIKEKNVEAYEAAIELYGGDLLPEDRYEDWAAMRREQLRGTYHEVLTRLARAYEARGQYRRSIERFKEIVARDPSNEETHRQLMRLYAATHQRQQALRQYKECCEALRKEIDAEPERITTELHKQIIAGHIQPLRGAEERGTQHGEMTNSLAILPFVNSGGDPDSEYLSDGITESIINTLSQLPQLKVMARSTVFRYKGVEIDPQEVGGRLGVRAVLTGRVLNRGNTLNIQAELVEVSDGSQVWGEQYTRNSSDIFEVQEDIAREITAKLRLRLSGEEKGRLTRRHTESTEAYHAYLRGQYFWNKRTTSWLRKSVGYFEQAVKFDPTYAVAYTGLSDAYTLLVTWESLTPEEGFAKAKGAAAKALEIDEGLGEAHASLAHAMLHNWEWTGAEREFKQAIALHPGYAMARDWYAEYLAAVGRFSEAVDQAKRAQEFDPLSLISNADVGWMLYYAGRYDEAVEQYSKTLELDPNFLLAHLQLGQVYIQKRMYDEALKELQEAFNLSGKSGLTELMLMGHAYAVSGRKEKAREMLKGLDELAGGRYFSAYRVALIYAGLGEKETAFQWLERAYDRHDAKLIWLKVDPMLDGLRSEPGFTELVRRVGLHESQI